MRMGRGVRLVLVLLLALPGFPVAGAAPRAAEFVPGMVLAKLRVSEPALPQARVRDRLAATGVTVLDVPPGNELRVAGALQRRGLADWAEPNWILTGDGTPDDARWSEQWGMHRVRAAEGWRAYPGTFARLDGVRVAVLDTGVDETHPDLSDGRVLPGADCLSRICTPGDASDVNGHGTHVAGIVAARANDAAGVAGVAYNSPILPVRVLGRDNSGDALSIHNGMLWAAENGAKVINMSLGSDLRVETLCVMSSHVHNTFGAVIVASAGNTPSGQARYPAACPGVIGVSSTTDGDAPAPDTNYGNHVFVAAPGDNSLSTARDGGYARGGGTSFASPVVSGLAALLASKNGGTPDEIATRIAQTADKPTSYVFEADPRSLDCDPGCTWNAWVGYGRVNVARALGSATPSFALSHFADPDPATPGETLSLALSVLRHGGHSASVAVTALGLPPDTTATPLSVPGSEEAATMTFVTGPATPAGEHRVTIRGDDGAGVAETAVTVVLDSAHAPGFTVELDLTTVRAARGETVTLGVLVERDAFDVPIDLELRGVPSGVTHRILDTPLVGNVATIELDVSAAAPAGDHPLTLVATAGTLTRSARATLGIAASRVVEAPYDVKTASCFEAEICIELTGADVRVSIVLHDDSARPVAGSATVHTLWGAQVVTVCGATSIELSEAAIALTLELDYEQVAVGCLLERGLWWPATRGHAVLRFNDPA